MTVATLLLVLVPALQDGAVIERTVKRTTIDALGRRAEVRRQERVLVKGGNLLIVDLTFGERLLVRSDLKRVWRADPLAGTVSDVSFDELAALRKVRLDEIEAARARVPGTEEEKELGAILEGFDRFASPPAVEFKVDGNRREIVLNGDLRRAAVEVDPKVPAAGWWEALAALGAFPPAVTEKAKQFGGAPVKGTLRYVLFMDRVIEQVEAGTAEAKDVADGEFEPPTGLRRVPFAGLERPAERKLKAPGTVPREFTEDDGEKKK